jgi:hypothetical protein
MRSNFISFFMRSKFKKALLGNFDLMIDLLVTNGKGSERQKSLRRK